MSYIGRGIDSIDNISTLDNLSFNGSDATFNLTKNGVAFTPVSSSALNIQIDGIIQANNFTISGSTLTFDFVPSASSVCNSVKHFGVGLLTTVSDGAITNVKLGADSVNGSKIADDSISDEHLDITAITGQTAITSLADTDKFLVSDASDSGNLKYVEKQYLPSGGRSTLIDTITLSNTTAPTFDSSDITSSFDNYLFVFENIQPGSGNVSMQAQLSNNNGSSYEGDSSNDYRRIKIGGRQDTSNNSILSDYDDTTNRISITGLNNAGNDAALKIDGFMYLFTPNSSSYKKTYSVVTYGEASDPPLFILDTAAHIADHTQSVINNIKFVMSSGNFASGKIKLFGLA